MKFREKKREKAVYCKRNTRNSGDRINCSALNRTLHRHFLMYVLTFKNLFFILLEKFGDLTRNRYSLMKI